MGSRNSKNPVIQVDFSQKVCNCCDGTCFSNEILDVKCDNCSNNMCYYCAHYKHLCKRCFKIVNPTNTHTDPNFLAWIISKGLTSY